MQSCGLAVFSSNLYANPKFPIFITISEKVESHRSSEFRQVLKNTIIEENGD